MRKIILFLLIIGTLAILMPACGGGGGVSDDAGTADWGTMRWDIDDWA